MITLTGETPLHTTIINLPQNIEIFNELLNELKDEKDLCYGGLIDTTCGLELYIPESFYTAIDQWESDEDDHFYSNLCLDITYNLSIALNIPR